MGEELVEVKNEIIETSEEITPVVQFKEWFVDSDLPQIPFRQLVNRALQDVNLASVISKIEKGTEYVVKVPLEFKKAYDEGKVFVKDDIVVWKCRNCGHIHVGKFAPKVCPVCSHAQAYFEVKAENY